MATSFALALLLAGAAVSGLSNARVESHVVEPGRLAATVEGLRGSAPGRLWIGWEVPTSSRSTMCCFDSVHRARSGHGGGCRLDRGASFFNGSPKDGRPVVRTVARVFTEVASRRIEDVRVFSEDCALDAGGNPVHWLAGVQGAESVAWLQGLVPAADADEVLAAIAAHADPAADRALLDLVAPGGPRDTREKAAFWLGESRGRLGYETLVKLLASDPDSDFREHVIFALSISDVPEAVDAIIRTAKSDRDPDVRSKALFWLGQMASQEAVQAIGESLEEDPDTEVKEQAVFALSQLPDEQGVPHLLRLARTHPNPRVREKAMFWLGQSEDPRALALFEEVLLKR
jgi:hypothetical protein